MYYLLDHVAVILLDHNPAVNNIRVVVIVVVVVVVVVV